MASFQEESREQGVLVEISLGLFFSGCVFHSSELWLTDQHKPADSGSISPFASPKQSKLFLGSPISITLEDILLLFFLQFGGVSSLS